MGEEIGGAHDVHGLLVKVPTAGIGKALGLDEYEFARLGFRSCGGRRGQAAAKQCQRGRTGMTDELTAVG